MHFWSRSSRLWLATRRIPWLLHAKRQSTYGGSARFLGAALRSGFILGSPVASLLGAGLPYCKFAPFNCRCWKLSCHWQPCRCWRIPSQEESRPLRGWQGRNALHCTLPATVRGILQRSLQPVACEPTLPSIIKAAKERTAKEP